MKTIGLSDAQKQALMDLLVVGMYADHNLASAEDACVGRLLDTFQFASDYDRQRFSDAAFTRASQHAGSPESIRAYVTQIAGTFPAREMRRSVYDTLNNLLTSDGKVTTEESQLLTTLKLAFQL
jgi:hypothetical protein